MTIEVRKYDSADYLTDEESIMAYLEEALADAEESGDLSLVPHALGVVARARGMSQIAASAGLSRESLYRALSSNGNPEFATILKVIRALGLRFAIKPYDSGDANHGDGNAMEMV